MTKTEDAQFEVHDRQALAKARAIMNATESPRAWAQEVVEAVKRNEEWRGERCINLLAPEAPTSPMVRALLSSEIGTRAAEGHIGRVNRWFAGTQYIDEVEALCVELLEDRLPLQLCRPSSDGQHARQHDRLSRADPARRCDHVRAAAVRRAFQQPPGWSGGHARPEDLRCAVRHGGAGGRSRLPLQKRPASTSRSWWSWACP